MFATLSLHFSTGSLVFCMSETYQISFPFHLQMKLTQTEITNHVLYTVTYMMQHEQQMNRERKF